ncbi:MAG: tetratricopeptide repeat protein [Planctomycetota bacterium]
MRSALRFALALLLAAPCAVAGAQDETSSDTATPSVQSSDDPFDLVAADLPRAEPGRWDGFFEGLARGEMDAGVSADVLERQARAERAYAVRDFRTSISLLFGILEELPDFPPGLLVLGTVEFRLRRYGECATLLERFVEIAPDQVYRTQALAHCYYSLGDYERARDHYLAVIEAGAESLEATRGLALALYRLGDLEGAMSRLDAVLAQEPDNFDALVWKAQILYEEQEFEDAHHLAERAERVAPWEPKPLFLQSRCLFELDREDEAERVRALARDRRAFARSRVVSRATAVRARSVRRRDPTRRGLPPQQGRDHRARRARRRRAESARERPGDRVPDLRARPHVGPR